MFGNFKDSLSDLRYKAPKQQQKSFNESESDRLKIQNYFIARFKAFDKGVLKLFHEMRICQ